MKRKILSIFLIITIVAGAFIFSSVQADSSVISPDIAMLDTILYGNRNYVIDTLINDDLSTNPHAKVNYISNEKSMMQTVLSQYGNTNDPNYSWIYKLAVDTMIALCSVEDYTNDIANIVTELGEDALEEIGGANAATSFLGDCVQSSKSVHYDNILQSVLSSDYTSSTGISVSGSDAQLTNLRRIYDAVDSLNNLNGYIKSLSGLDQSTAETTTQYLNNVLIPAADSYENVIKSFAKVSETDVGISGQAMLDFTKALSVAVMYDSNVISTQTAGEKITTIAPQYLLDDATIELIDLNANLSKFASNTLDSYMYIKAIQTQKKAVAGPLQRTANKMTDADSSDVLKRYAYLIENASDQKATNYQWIIQMLKNKGIVEGFIEDKLSTGMTKLAERLIPLYDESIIPSSLANLTGVVSTTINLGDAVTGVKNTALKTLELKELNELIDCFKQTYREDLQNYKDVPTEDNAAKVLDDLSFIQRMRLRGESLAYKMALNQINTPLGKLLSGGYDSSAYYTKHYQNHVDAIIGASVMPISTGSIDVPKGTTVTIWHDPEIGTYADVSDSDGNSYSIAEVAYRLPNGINLSTGGTLNIYSGDAVTIPYVINSGGVVALNNNSPCLGEYVQNSGTLSLTGASNKNINNLYLYGGTVSSVDSADIIVDNFASSGEATVTNAAISVYDRTTLGGKLHASLNCYGDIVGSSGYIDNLTLCGTGPQAVDGTLYPTNLLFNNTSSGGITVNGTINVSGGITNTASNIKNGENTVLKNTGYINGDYYNSSLTLDGTTITAYKKFGGSLYTQGAVNIADVQIDAVLSQSNGTLNLNGNVAVKDDVYFGGTVVQSSDKTFDLKGDLTASDARLGNVNVCGKLGQTINSAVTVNNFSNNNISNSGLTLNAAVTVNGQVSSKKAPVNSKNVTLTSTASFKEPEYFGDITINGLAGSLPATLHGKLYLQGNMTQTSDSIITEDIEMSAGTVTIKNAKLTGDKKIILTGGNITLENAELISESILNTSSGTAVTIDESSKLSAMSDTNINGAITGDGQLDTYGDLQNSGAVKVGDLKIQATLPVRFSGNDITVNNLITEGEAPITLNNKINVLNAYTNNCVAINSGNIVFSEGNNIDGDIQYAENMNVTGDLVIDGHAVSVAENAEITGNVIIQNGGKLNVGKNFVVKNGNVTLLENSTMTVGGKTDISASSTNSMLIDATSEVELKKLVIITKLGNITVDGSLCFGSDTSLSSVNLNGSGTVSLKGDLYLSSSAVNQPDTFVLNGKAPQILSGGTMNFKNIIIENPSRKGVTFSSNATYSGELTNNNSNVSGTLNKQ